MARRSILVAVVALAAAIVPGSALAGTPSVTTTQFATPVGLSWAVTATLTETVYRAPGPCAAIPMPGQVGIGTFVGTPPVDPDPGTPPTVTTLSDAPGEGTFCYYVQDDGLAYSGGAQATVDTLPPTATINVAISGAPNFVRGAVAVTGTSADSGSGVLSSVLSFGPAGACQTTTILANLWNTAALADGAADVCNVVNDNAAHAAAAVQSVIVDNTLPVGGVVTPAPGTFISGNAYPLTTSAADVTSGVRQVQWQRSGNGTANWQNIGAALAGPSANGFQRNWNTGANAVGDGPDYVHAVITDNAGNQITTATTAVTVDNTPPDGKAVVTAPPAVAGSPTITWTPAHDAIGIARYDVVRSGTVIGTVASIAGATSYSFNDKNAPDQATSNYVVRAYDATDHSIDSDAVPVLVDSNAQSAPRSLGAPTPTGSAPALTWTAPAVFGVAHYDIYRDGTLLGSTSGPQTSYTDPSATEGVHDYAVLARDASAHPGVLSASFKVVFDTTPPTSGGAPTAQLLPDGRVQLSWPLAGDALSGVSGYVVRRATGGTPPAAADGGTAVCAPAVGDCIDASTSSGTWSYGFFARDAAGNVALIGTVAGVVINDRTAPLAPTKLTLTRAKSKASVTNITFTLRWARPTAPDLDRIVVVLNLKHAPKEPADGRAIYKGLGTSTKIKLKAGQTGYLALFAYDHSGNVSVKPARSVVRLAALIPLRPLTGSTVRTASPLLSWKPKKGTAYYNVQLFINGKRVLVGWPSKASYRIPKAKLVPGTYVWYVWPAAKQKKRSPTFGKLIGRAVFTYKK